MYRPKRGLKYLICALLALVSFLIVHNALSDTNSYGDNSYKVQRMESLMSLAHNRKRCKIPELQINNSEILQFYTHGEEINCANSGENDWVVCMESICYVREEVITKNGDVTCSYFDIIRKTDNKVKYGRPTKTKDSYILTISDFAKASCKAANGKRWVGLVIGIRKDLSRNITKSTNSHINILMFGLDSLSHNAFIRKLPKSYAYIKDTLQSVILNGYNIVGDGTPQALIPILTGNTELELPETRRRIAGSVYVDSYPMIWKEYEKYGYVTAFNEDLPVYGTFTYRMNGFDRQPTDHYMRPFYLELQNILDTYEKYCIGSEKGHNVMLNYTKNFMLKYKNYPKFVFSFHGELSHDSVNLIGAADDDILSWLKDLKEQRILDNTILIVMSDHGNRFADVRNTLQGKQEERLPFFSITVPESFKLRHNDAIRNLINNVDRLTTPFDVHETLLDVLRLDLLLISDKKLDKKHKQRAISLFQNISDNRSCSDAYIEPHWCSCLVWKQINNILSDVVQNSAISILKTINEYTKAYRTLCSSLEISTINWAIKIEPHNELVEFKKNKDADGYVADLSSGMKVRYEMYQLQVTVVPGNSIFEASVEHNLDTNKFNTNIAQISRINKYGNQANCIYDRNPEIRKYCFCV